MDVSQVFGGDTLKAADLQGAEPTVVIATVKMKEFDKGNKLIITFQGKKKALVCNKTNASRIAYIYGPNTDDWIGREIVLFTDLVDFQGKTVEAIRIRPPAKRPPANGSGTHVVENRGNYDTLRRTEPVNVPAGEPPSDEIPF